LLLNHVPTVVIQGVDQVQVLTVVHGRQVLRIIADLVRQVPGITADLVRQVLEITADLVRQVHRIIGGHDPLDHHVMVALLVQLVLVQFR
jgi:hypothetical protein